MYNEGIKTFTANSAVYAGRRVKLSGGTTSPPDVELAGAGEYAIGTCEHDAADNELVSVRLNTQNGTHEVEVAVSSAIAQGTALYGAASGRMSDASSGTQYATALEAASATGDHIEVLLINC